MDEITPTTKDQIFLVKIIRELMLVNENFSAVMKQLEKLNTSPTVNTDVDTKLDAKAVAKIVTDELKKSFKAKP